MAGGGLLSLCVTPKPRLERKRAPHLWIRVLGKNVQERRLATLRVAHHHDLAAQESFALHRLTGWFCAAAARLTFNSGREESKSAPPPERNPRYILAGGGD